MRALVTGIAGYIAPQLALHLKQRGYEIIGVDRCLPAQGSACDEFIHGDLFAEKVLASAFSRKIDLVCHLAASKHDYGISRETYFRDNTSVTERLLRLGTAKGVDDWLFFSSVAAMGPSVHALDERSPTRPVGPYGESKLAAERLFESMAEERPTARVVTLRPSVVYGPGNPPENNVHRLIKAVHDNRFVMVGDGSTLKSTSYLDNLLSATSLLLDQMRPGLEVVIYTDEPIQTNAWMVERIAEELGRPFPRYRLPLPVARYTSYVADLVGRATGRDLPVTSARIRKFCTDTNFDASVIRRAGFHQPISNEEAMSRTVRWFLSQRGAA